jgi:hypothetical protein
MASSTRRWVKFFYFWTCQVGWSGEMAHSEHIYLECASRETTSLVTRLLQIA